MTPTRKENHRIRSTIRSASHDPSIEMSTIPTIDT